MLSLSESIKQNVGIGKYAKEIGGYHIGDIIVSVYQYSARSVNFYEIIDLKGSATAVVRKLAKKDVSSDGYGQNGSCLPVKGEYVGDEIKIRCGKRGFHIRDKYDWCYKFEGKPEDYYTD